MGRRYSSDNYDPGAGTDPSSGYTDPTASYNQGPSLPKQTQAPDPNAPAVTSTSGTPATPAPTDPNSAIAAIYAKYGLDPTNPGHGLAGADYFYGRGNETGGGWTNQDNQNYWLGANGGSGRIEQEIQKALGGQVGNLIDTGSGSSYANGQPDTSGYSAAMRDALMKRIGELQTPIDQNNPQIAGAIGAYRTSAQRNMADIQKMLAERAYAQGASGGAGVDQAQLGQQNTQAAERAATQENEYDANLVNQAEQNRQSQLASLLGMGSNNALGYAGLAQSGQNFNNSLGYQYAAMQAQMNRDALLQSLGLL